VRKADNLTIILTVFMKSGMLNFLEPSGPLQGCNGTALPLPLPYHSTSVLENFKTVKVLPCLILSAVQKSITLYEGGSDCFDNLQV
jgi:hypothetical protein